MSLTKNGKQKQHQNIFKVVKYSNRLTNPTQGSRNLDKICQKSKVFTCMWNDGKEEASLGSCGRDIQSLGAAEEKAHSHVPTKNTPLKVMG